MAIRTHSAALQLTVLDIPARVSWFLPLTAMALPFAATTTMVCKIAALSSVAQSPTTNWMLFHIGTFGVLLKWKKGIGEGSSAALPIL